jgi:hypothetical protein
MANPFPDKPPQGAQGPENSERSIDQGREEAREPGAPASTGLQSPGTPSKGAVRPKSPREFIQERMRELDKKGS